MKQGAFPQAKRVSKYNALPGFDRVITPDPPPGASFAPRLVRPIEQRGFGGECARPRSSRSRRAPKGPRRFRGLQDDGSGERAAGDGRAARLCGNADCSVTAAFRRQTPNRRRPAAATTRHPHCPRHRVGFDLRASLSPAARNSFTVHSRVCMNAGVAARRPHTLSPASRLSSEKPTISCDPSSTPRRRAARYRGRGVNEMHRHRRKPVVVVHHRLARIAHAGRDRRVEPRAAALSLGRPSDASITQRRRASGCAHPILRTSELRLSLQTSNLQLCR